MLLSKKEFAKASLNKRYKAILDDGEYIGARLKGAHRVHLFCYNGFFVEVWILVSFDQLHWIEIQNNSSIVAEYTESVDLKKSLGL